MKLVITGGAGFIGSHLTDFLLGKGHSVTIFDNLSWGKKKFIVHLLNNPRFRFKKLDLLHISELERHLDPETHTVFHLAANSDIMRGADDPDIDFNNTTVATLNLLKIMKKKGVKRIFFTSGSGVYGDAGDVLISETYGPLFPKSMYGATKLAAEGLIASFVNLFDMQAWILRPANIIGPRATHGVVLDFIKKLKKNTKELTILGSGNQCKSYLYIDDVLEAMHLVWTKTTQSINLFNLTSESFITVNEIAKIVMEEMRISNVMITRTGSSGGWKGDVPIIKMTNDAIKHLEWRAQYSSADAVAKTVRALLSELR